MNLAPQMQFLKKPITSRYIAVFYVLYIMSRVIIMLLFRGKDDDSSIFLRSHVVKTLY